MQKPAVFIASSVEGLPVADAINFNLDHDTQNTLWRVGTFKLASNGLDDLIKKSSVVDFAVFVFTPDDLVTIRKKEEHVARDNVVFELGLFIGSLGKNRCYVVKPRGIVMHLPSDLLGVTTADYEADRSDGDIASALNAACKLIKDQVRELGVIRPSALAARVTPAPHVPNPPDYMLKQVDLKFLAQCVQSHVATPNGMPFNWISRQLKGEPDYRISLSAAKLMRLGYIEKSIQTDNSQEDGEYFAYRATDYGIDIFLKHEDEYASLQTMADMAALVGRGFSRAPASTPARAPTVAAPPAPKSTSGFDDMDDDIPF